MKRYFLVSALLISPLHYCCAAEEDTKKQIIQDLFKAEMQRNAEKIIEVVDTADWQDKKELANIALKICSWFDVTIEIASALIERGAEPNETFRDTHPAGETLLSLALKTNRDSPTIIPRLLALGANPNLPNKHGQTPLHVCALYSGRDHTIEDIALLLRHGANPLAKNNQGETPRETIPSYNWTLSPEISQENSQLLQEAETKIIQKKIQKIHEQGIPQRNFKMRGKKIPAHLLAAASSTESHSTLFNKPWPGETAPQ